MPESIENCSKNVTAMRRLVEFRCAFLHLGDDHLDEVVGQIKLRVGHEHDSGGCRVPLAITRAGKSERKQIYVGDGSRVALRECFEDRVLGYREKTVCEEIALYE